MKMDEVIYLLLYYVVVPIIFTGKSLMGHNLFFNFLHFASGGVLWMCVHYTTRTVLDRKHERVLGCSGKISL